MNNKLKQQMGEFIVQQSIAECKIDRAALKLLGECYFLLDLAEIYNDAYLFDECQFYIDLVKYIHSIT